MTWPARRSRVAGCLAATIGSAKPLAVEGRQRLEPAARDRIGTEGVAQLGRQVVDLWTLGLEDDLDGRARGHGWIAAPGRSEVDAPSDRRSARWNPAHRLATGRPSHVVHRSLGPHAASGSKATATVVPPRARGSRVAMNDWARMGSGVSARPIRDGVRCGCGAPGETRTQRPLGPQPNALSTELRALCAACRSDGPRRRPRQPSSGGRLWRRGRDSNPRGRLPHSAV